MIWRAGKEAGFVGWGEVLASPARYDVNRDPDPFWKGAPREIADEDRAPLRVWAAGHIAKAEVAALLPNHRIVVAPMGTVFPLDDQDLGALEPLLAARGYDLARPTEVTFTALPLRPGQPTLESTKTVQPTPAAKITPALFLLSSSPEQPVEIAIEGDSLRLLLAEREALASLDESWDAVGVYLLITRANGDAGSLRVYVGKAQGLRSRIRTGHNAKEWQRCLLIQRPGLQAFNASDISWLERRLIDILLEAPAVDLVNKTPPPPEAVPTWKAEILERTVLAALGVLGVLGAYVA